MSRQLIFFDEKKNTKDQQKSKFFKGNSNNIYKTYLNFILSPFKYKNVEKFSKFERANILYGAIENAAENSRM